MGGQWGEKKVPGVLFSGLLQIPHQGGPVHDPSGQMDLGSNPASSLISFMILHLWAFILLATGWGFVILPPLGLVGITLDNIWIAVCKASDTCVDSADHFYPFLCLLNTSRPSSLWAHVMGTECAGGCEAGTQVMENACWCLGSDYSGITKSIYFVFQDSGVRTCPLIPKNPPITLQSPPLSEVYRW